MHEVDPALNVCVLALSRLVQYVTAEFIAGAWPAQKFEGVGGHIYIFVFTSAKTMDYKRG